MPKKKSKLGEGLKVGWLVAIALKSGAAPLRSYAGKIQAIDDRGLRITLMDWIVGAPVSWDLYVPFSSLESALVATPDHDTEGFGERAGQWQEQMEKLKGQ